MRALVIALTLALAPVPGVAQDTQAGLAAYQRGDCATALVEWRPLAEQGNAEAQYNLGVLYDQGLGVPQDYAEALRWYRLAAERGLADAQNHLGVLYATGRGVPEDNVTAHMWLNLAGVNGVRPANEALEAVSRLMSPADISEAQRRAEVCRASNEQDCD